MMPKSCRLFGEHHTTKQRVRAKSRPPRRATARTGRPGDRSVLRLLLGQALALGFGEFLELFFAHGFVHFARSALEFALFHLAALGRKGGAGGLLLGLGGGRHGVSPLLLNKANVPPRVAFPEIRPA